MAYTIPVSISAYYHTDKLQQYVPSSDFKVFVQYDNSTSAVKYDPVARIALQPGYNLLVLSAFGQYSGIVSTDIEAYADVALADVEFNDSSFVYTGLPITPSFDVKIAGTQIRPSYAAKKILFPNSSSPLFTKQYPDYDAFSTSYINNLNAGEASVVLSSNAVETSRVKTFQIDHRSMQDISVQIDGFETDVDYKGRAVVQSISVQIGSTMISSAYYTVSYSHNDALGQALCKVEGKTNLSGTVEKTFNIWGNLSDASISVQEKIDYTGDSIYASPQIKLFDILLNSSEHYSLQYDDSDYIKPGIKHGLVVGLESGYVHSTPTRDFQYQIVGNAASAVVFGPSDKYTYTGLDIKPPFDVILDDVWLDSGIDYSTSYPSEDYSSIGQKQIQINGIGNYISAQAIDYAIYDPNSTEQINTLVYKVDGSIQTIDTKHLTREALGIDGQVDRKISKVIVGSQVETLENRLFSNCKMLTYVSLKNCSEDIELPDECFDGCFRLQTVVFPGQHADDSYTIKKYAYGNNGYIDTGYIPTSHTTIGIQLFLDEKYNGIPIAGFSSNGILKINNDYRLTVPSQNQIVFRIGGVEWTYNKSQMLKPGMTHQIIFQRDGLVCVDGTLIAGIKKEYSYIDRVLSHSICVFGQSDAQTTNAIVERIRIYGDNGTVKMDLVPAVDALGIGCLVDKLTEKKYYSQNGHDIVCTDEYGKPEYYFVEFDPNGGTIAIDVKKVKSGDSIGTLPQAKKEGYLLSAWIDSIAQSEVSPTTVVDDDILCIAKWLALTKVIYKDSTFHSITNAYYNVNGPLNTAKAPTAASDTADSLYAGDSVTSLASIGSIGAFEGSKLVHVYLTDKITSIPNNAFKACGRLQSIQLGNYTSSIGDNSFFSTTQLSSIELPQSVSSIGTQAFYNSGLAELDISRLTSLIEVKRSTFGACSKLSSVKLPNSILSIGARAFSNCQALSSIDLPGLLQTIDNEAFSSNESLTSLSVHSHVESVSANTFQNCTRLQSVAVDGIDAWNGIQFANSMANPLYYAHNLYDLDNDGALVERVNIQYGQSTSISPYLYVNCYSITDATIEDGITQIGKGAFSNCCRLSTVGLADSVSSIGTSAFSECSSLIDINIPSGLIDVESYAFSRSGILSLILSSESLCAVSRYAFADSKLNSISVDGNSLSIGKQAFYNCYDLTCAHLGKGIDSYQFNGEDEDQGLFTGCSSLVDVVLPFDSSSKYAISQINDKEGICYPFGKSQYEGSVPVQNKYYTYYVPASLRCMTVLDTRNHSAYKKLFENLSMLSCVHIGDSLSSIQQMAFYMCSGIQKIVVASSVTSIDEYAFALDDQDGNAVLPNLTCVAFEGRSINQVSTMIQNYPWHLAESTISCELD